MGPRRVFAGDVGFEQADVEAESFFPVFVFFGGSSHAAKGFAGLWRPDSSYLYHFNPTVTRTAAPVQYFL